ncbi:hypothetical protein CC78DRAFT_578958 [Lojkania enalia]|uniref:DNA polymerase delta subunit 3 n=1 Tax=Lojkania enalia TaxID=147567 RepID=A0A9P4N185_9PLEO|nr:hypothetical protein CC78DRAFT_578958 [Didymosphaeria enalia]
MADEYKEFLAAKVLADGRPVTYRLLSRALKVNVNTAKQMLYDFHTKQNAKKPNSVHATYLLTGKKRSPEHTNGANGTDGGDTFMRSSPYMSSMPEPEEPAEELVMKTSIVLVREEELEKIKSEYEDITSIHIYSLQSGPIENLNILSTCNQQITAEYADEDPLERWRYYGSIHNPYIKKRTAKYTPALTTTQKPASEAAAKPAATPTIKKEAASPERRGTVLEDNTLGRSTSQPASASNVLKKSNSKPNLKRDTSDIFKSFAKAKPKAKDAEESKESTPAPPEDEHMQGMSEDEGGEDDAPIIKYDEKQAAAARKARIKHEKLRKMMEEPDDEEMPDAPPDEEKDHQDGAIDKAPESKPTESEAAVIVQGGRRRGRRKVMKKKTTKDEDGYLVTKEEAVWESFSEDEPEPKRPKPAPKPATTAKGKKTGKQGQGNIANFFRKA